MVRSLCHDVVVEFIVLLNEYALMSFGNIHIYVLLRSHELALAFRLYILIYEKKKHQSNFLIIFSCSFHVLITL